MSDEVGLRTQFLNWKNNFPKDLGIEPHFIMISFRKPNGWIEQLPGLPEFVKTRIRAAIEIREGLREGPFDATFIAVHSVLSLVPGYSSKHPCFTTLDVTPKQLHSFGGYYGKYPSKVAAIELFKHRSRKNNYNSYRGLFPWSNWAANSLIEDYGVSVNKITVVPPGVDTNTWKPSEIRTFGKISNLLFVGGDFERKGGVLLLDWAKRTKLENWRLDIVTRQEIKTNDPRIKIHNNLQSNDPVLADLYRNASIFVLPTLADCYSIAGIEALASGLPVILSLTGGTGDVVQDGRTGYLLTTPSFEELEKKLQNLTSDSNLRLSMATAARADALERYDVVKNIHKIVSIMFQSI